MIDPSETLQSLIIFHGITKKTLKFKIKLVNFIIFLMHPYAYTYILQH